MNNRVIPESELVLNPNGSVYHLNVRQENLAKTIILVGDQGRVPRVSSFFDSVEFTVQSREFLTHTGKYKGRPISVVSTGIGTDNIDIVLNELDAAFNIDPVTRKVKENLTKLRLVRIGTSGALQPEIPVDSFVASSHGLGFDGLLHFYRQTISPNEDALCKRIAKHLSVNGDINKLYLYPASPALLNRLAFDMISGITATANGFYGPQGRALRLEPMIPDLNEKLTDFNEAGLKITNFEMETSALYGLSALLGHEACTVCAIVANRINKEFSKDYHKTIDRLIQTVLDRVFE